MNSASPFGFLKNDKNFDIIYISKVRKSLVKYRFFERGTDRKKENSMTIDVSFNCERNETIIGALKSAHGDRCIIDQLCKEHGEASVLNALYHATDDEDCPDELKYFDWEYHIQEWLYEYFYEDCMSYVFDAVFGEDR